MIELNNITNQNLAKLILSDENKKYGIKDTGNTGEESMTSDNIKNHVPFSNSMYSK